MDKVFDTIIIGGGSAGCVLANRLTENPDHKVLVIEAGRKDAWWDIFVHMPAALTYPIGSKFYDWQYKSEPEPFMNNRQVYHARGKILGGSSSINGMIFIRGNAMDYEKWAKDPGMETWDYAHCLPYFKKSETRTAGTNVYRGGDGPLHLETGPATNPLFKAFFTAAKQAGYPLTDDVNGFQQEGFGMFDRNIKNGKRWSASDAYLHPVLGKRKNLEVICGALTTKILFTGKRATGVEFLKGNSLQRVTAGEVICCGGAINSPQLLQLSGIGNPETLKSAGVQVLHDLPGVGENLQDHLEVYIQYACKKPVSVWPALKWYNKPWVGLQWMLFKKGPASTNHFEGGGFVRSNETVAYPNLQFHFLPVAIRYDGTSPSGGHGYQVHVGPMNSDARGTIKIKSADPKEKPAILFNYLSTEQDRREWVEAIRCARKILNQPAMEEFNGGELSPGRAVDTDEQILEWVKRDSETALHPSCTCRMGVDKMSVVDPLTLKVHGLECLRVVDGSVMPYVTNGNLYAPIMMIAEKAADIIAGNQPLKPEKVEFYKKPV
ncbi:MAG: choline dehydrogenase [Chitinophagaceae bacterium]